ncbi:hemopexin repeat-containing protein [Streptomyces sp. NPDC048290]|uniref:hemopexin repeat-containing protein n=1 Tax=Streptomyces sp. NPDC048290 TaxID=3155811 RepID=UPI0034462076
MAPLTPITADGSGGSAYSEFMKSVIIAIMAGQTPADFEGRRVYRTDVSHPQGSRGNTFAVRIRASEDVALDYYVRRDNLYGIGFAPVIGPASAPEVLYYFTGGQGEVSGLDLGISLRSLELEENYQRLESVARHPRWNVTISEQSLADAIRRVNPETPAPSRADAVIVIAEMISEALRFRWITRTVNNAWHAFEAVSQADRRQMVELERNWDTIGGFLQRLNADPLTPPDPRALQPLAIGTETFATVKDIAAVLLIMLWHRAAGGGSRVAVSEKPAAGAGSQLRGIYPILDAAADAPDGTAWFLRSNECLKYDCNTDKILSGPAPLRTAWRGLAKTDFANGVDAASGIPLQEGVWLFRGSQYVHYSPKQQKVIRGPKEIYDGWPGLQDTNFVDYLDAALADPGGANVVYLFRDSEFVRYNLADDTKEGPTAIKDWLTGLTNTPFAQGINAALAVQGNPDRVWLFRADEYMCYDRKNHTIVTRKQVPAGWAPFQAKQFVDRIDAALPHPTLSDQIWFFHDDWYLRYDAANDTITKRPTLLTDGWPGLASVAGFNQWIDAALPMPAQEGQPNQAWFFHGHTYLRYDLDNDTIKVNPTPIEDGWPGLKSVGFDRVDVATAVSGNPHEAWFFKDDQYVRYDLRTDKVLNGGAKPIAEGWPPLGNTGFAYGIDTAIGAGGDDVWFFKGNAYVRYNVDSDVLVVGPKAIVEGWKFIVPAS